MSGNNIAFNYMYKESGLLTILSSKSFNKDDYIAVIDEILLLSGAYSIDEGGEKPFITCPSGKEYDTNIRQLMYYACYTMNVEFAKLLHLADQCNRTLRCGYDEMILNIIQSYHLDYYGVEKAIKFLKYMDNEYDRNFIWYGWSGLRNWLPKGNDVDSQARIELYKYLESVYNR